MIEGFLPKDLPPRLVAHQSSCQFLTRPENRRVLVHGVGGGLEALEKQFEAFRGNRNHSEDLWVELTGGRLFILERHGSAVAQPMRRIAKAIREKEAQCSVEPRREARIPQELVSQLVARN